MESRLKGLGHPVHPMLVVFPLGLFVTASLFDFIDVVGGPDFFGPVAYWNIVPGLVGGVLGVILLFAGILAFRTFAVSHLDASSSVNPRVQWLSRLGGAR